MRRLTLLLVALALALVACDSKPDAQPTPSPSVSARPSSTALIAIVSPTPGQTVPTSGVTVRITLTGARVLPSPSARITPDEGHIHLAVDGKTITLFAGLQVSTGPLSLGDHLIQVEFAAADHGFFNPRVIQTVTVTAK